MNTGRDEEGEIAGGVAIIVESPVVSDREKRRVSIAAHQISAMSEVTELVRKLVEEGRFMVNRITSAGGLENRNMKTGTKMTEKCR